MKIKSLILALILVLCAVLPSCSSGIASDKYTVQNLTSSDYTYIADSLGANYLLANSSEEISLEGKNIIICVAYENDPFDMSGFNDDGYIIRRIDDDILICGKTENATKSAVSYFKGQYVSTNGNLVYADELNYVHGSADRLGKVTLNGVGIENYTVVIPHNPTAFEEHAAQILQDYLYDAGGITIMVSDDLSAEKTHEIVIGDTSRKETPENREYGDMEYYLGVKNGDIVIDGLSYMVGGGIGKLIADYLSPEDGGDVALDGIGDGGIYTYEPCEAKSVILMIGDGMGYNHIKYAEYLAYIDEFYAYKLPVLGSSVTYSYSGTTDSAASATAMACGYKTVNGYVGMDKNGNVMENVRELADSVGGRTAIVTTDSISGATPAGFMAHTLSRGDTAGIQSWYEKTNIEYVRGYVDWNLFYDTYNAISYIGESGDPFFIMIEEAYTDKGGHSNDEDVVGEAVERFNETIAYAMEYAVCHTDTVLIITADHETGGIKERRGKYYFTSKGHTNADVPLFAIGYGTEQFNGKRNENISIATFIASVFGDDSFGNLG